VADYKLSVARSARKELQAMDRVVAMRIISRLEPLAQDPRPAGCAKLEGAADLWRVRVGDYRIIYTIDDRARTVDVSVVRHRRDAYRP
jgi:mRNA interferase RelE/StbE